MNLIISFILWLVAVILTLMGYENQLTVNLPYIGLVAAIASIIFACVSGAKKKTWIGTALLTLLNLALIYLVLISLLGSKGEPFF